MRREDERGLAAQELGELVDAVAREAGQAVEAVGVDDERRGTLEQRGDHAHGATRDAHAGTHEHGRAAGGEICHLGAGRVGEGAVGVGRQAHHRDLEQVRAGQVGHRLGHGEGHVAGAGARRRLGSHDGRAREARGAAHHEDAAARVLVHHAGGRVEHVEVVLGLAAPSNRVRLIDELLGLLGKRGHHDRAADVAAVVGEQARLERQHRDRDVSHHHGAGRVARLRGEAARHVHRDHARARGIERIDPDGERRHRRIVEARAQHRIDYRVAVGEQLVQLVAGRPHHVVDARLSRALGDDARQVAVQVVGVAGGDHLDRDALGLELLGRDPAVAAVVAQARQHGDVRDVAEAQHLLRRRTAGAMHELGDAHAHVGETLLDRPDVLHVQNRLHGPLTSYPARARVRR